VVVAIISILAAIAVPNLLEAQARSKVSAALGNLRSVALGLEAYAVDHMRYPATAPQVPGDPLGLLASYQLRGLTTPVAYVSPSAFRDPFGTIKAEAFVPRSAAGSREDFPEVSLPNRDRSSLYYHYPTMARRFNDVRYHRDGSGIVSIGPDVRDSLGAYRPLQPDFFRLQFAYTGLGHPLDTVYDPTNGTVSFGDIVRFTSAVRVSTP
jgi:type II secretory pathway pseudopilin PulG